MSKKQLFSRITGFGRRRDNGTSASPMTPRNNDTTHQNGTTQQQPQQQSQQLYPAYQQQPSASHDEYNGTNNNTNNYNGTSGHHHNPKQNHYTTNNATSPNNSNNNSSKANGTNINQTDHTPQQQPQQPQAQPHSKSHRSHKARSKHSNGKSKKGRHTERMTIETSLLSTEMSQEDVAKLLRLDAIPAYHVDDRGYIDFARGLFIDQRYILLETLGRGTFSKVFEAIDVVDKTKVAVKVIRNSHRYIEAAKTELRVLQHITNADDGHSCCIHLKSNFHWNKHPCLGFKLYGPSIYTVMAKNHYRPFPDHIVKDLTAQICTAIQFMHHLGIIFTDLKPENMVFVDGRTQAIINKHGKQEFIPVETRIKLVDFGSAVYEPIYDPNNPKTHKFKNGYNYLIQTRHYRAPEVVLEMPWKRAVDIWSIGCVILEFLFGSMVFNTHCAIDHLNQMQKMIGKVPDRLIQESSDKAYDELFTNDGKLNLENAKVSRAQAKPLRNYFNLENIEHQALYDLVQRTLRWEAKDRITADAILRHAYFQINTNDTSQAIYSGTTQQTTTTQQNSYVNGHSQPQQAAALPQQQQQQQPAQPRYTKPTKNGYTQAPAQQAPQVTQVPPAQQAQAQQQVMQQQFVAYSQQMSSMSNQRPQAQQVIQQQPVQNGQQQAVAVAVQQQQRAQVQYNNGNNNNNSAYSQPYIQ